MSEPKTFDPARYLTKVGSGDYLEVKWRLVWLREVHPDAILETELVHHGNNMAIFKATVSLRDGGSATGYGSEEYDDFRDFIEKAETKAIGRALGALGFGTQFTSDHEFGGAVADSPVTRVTDPASGATGHMSSKAYTSGPDRNAGPKDDTKSVGQQKLLDVSIDDLGKTMGDVDAELLEEFGLTWDMLGRYDASKYLEKLQKARGRA